MTAAIRWSASFCTASHRHWRGSPEGVERYHWRFVCKILISVSFSINFYQGCGYKSGTRLKIPLTRRWEILPYHKTIPNPNPKTNHNRNPTDLTNPNYNSKTTKTCLPSTSTVGTQHLHNHARFFEYIRTSNVACSALVMTYFQTWNESDFMSGSSHIDTTFH